MPEGISENPPPKKPGIADKIIRTVKESLPWDPTGKKKRLMKPTLMPEKDLPDFIAAAKASRPRFLEGEKTEQREAPKKVEGSPNTLASKKFITFLRELDNPMFPLPLPVSYRQDLYQPQYLRSRLGFLVEKPAEEGFFDLASVMRVANDRYKLPLAIYVDQRHARLVVKGVYRTPGGRKIMVYDPIHNGFQEIGVNVTEGGSPIGITGNGLVGSRIVRGDYDIIGFFEVSHPQIANFRKELTDIKAFNFQKDLQNCIPYCLFVDAMIHGLEPGNTPFKTSGIKQFEQDFGVRIMTREEILPKPRVRLV